jgi:hypothetical protein
MELRSALREPRVPSGVVAGVDAVRARGLMQEPLKLAQEVAVQQLEVMGKLSVKAAIDQPQLGQAMPPEHHPSVTLEAHRLLLS